MLSASLWDDDDVPLTYAMYFVDPRSGAAQTVQTRSENSFGTTKLPAGIDEEGNLVTCGGLFRPSTQCPPLARRPTSALLWPKSRQSCNSRWKAVAL